MSTIAGARRAEPPTRTSPLLQAVTALVAGWLLFFVFLFLLLIGYDTYYSGRIYPGVSISGVDMSGMLPEEAAKYFPQRINYPQMGKIAFQNAGTVWVATPADLGLSLDVVHSIQAAYDLGRKGDLFSRSFSKLGAWYSGKNLSPLMLYDERQARTYLEGIAYQIDRPTIEAGLQINGTEVSATPGQIGRRVEIASLLPPLQNQISNMTDGMFPLVVVETPPEILDASQAAETARQILSAPLVLQVPDAQTGDPGPWVIEPQRLVDMLAIERVVSEQGGEYQVGLKTEALSQFLQEQAPSLVRSPQNARFIFNDDTHQLENIQQAVIGRGLNLETSMETIREKLVQGEHNIGLSFDYTQPQVGSDATPESLGITQLVSSHTSYFRGSTASRMQNIETASARFHGLLVPPGATFSMAEAMGDVSLDNGYSEALIIFGGRTIKGVGGGVCQVSTTLFRTVFFAGFPIVERNPHAYRVGYYEQSGQGIDPNLAGLDATVFVPLVDFKFVNDTPYWLLMETYFNPKTQRLTWKFYSTSDGRSVDWNTTGPQNIVEPPEPLYEENPDLAPGEIKQVDWAAQGADVTVTRVVLRNGEVVFRDQFTTAYQPWRDIFQYGPGTQIPGD